ncbi:hypothetical protein [Psychroserpens algicola]|uniref:hypothetical protein n=1 Tax=Psychroserpens algicola TaxID=1719034 RepID=UPI0019532458|nr:hypothetical protein [Psychroserpens algicola]
MKQKKLDSHITSGFKTPKDYFSQVEEQILNEVHLKKKVETSGFDLPESYFESLEDRILDRIETKDDAKVISIFNWKKVIYTSAVAASIILIFNLFYSSETITWESIETASIENYIEQEDYTGYELASLLTEDELNKANFIDNQIPESSLENYLIETIEIEDLILEQAQ